MSPQGTSKGTGEAHLFGDAPAELPADAGLHGEDDVVHVDLARPPRVLGVDERVGEHLRRVAVRELEQLVQHARLCVLYRRCGREQERDRPRGRREVVGHGRAGHSVWLKDGARYPA